MKKNAFLVLVFLLAAFGIQAQSTTAATKVEYGLSLGANLSNISGNGMAGSYGTGFTAGAFSRIPFSAKWNLQPEVLFNYVNTKKSTNFLEYYVNTGRDDAANQIHLSYVSVPLLLGYQVSKTFTLNAGPQYSFLIYENDNLLVSNKTAYKRNDLGVAAGVQLHLENLSFYARYVWGVLNVNNIDDRYKWYNRQVQLGISLKIF